MRKFLIMMMFVLSAAVAAGAAATWEEVNAPSPAVVQSIGQDGELDVVVRDGYIYLWSEKTVTVKLFSILGQQISQETLKPGLHRIRMASRGIYILRTGTTTRRITI